MIYKALPKETRDPDIENKTRRWKPGRPLPRADEEGGQAGGQGQVAGDYRCSVCQEEFDKGNKFKYHYEECHA
eukprot:3947839-Heterocapsa_arctica.AAC.1